MQLMPQAEARLTAGDPVKNARALLRYALPIKNESARRIQVRVLRPSCCTITSGHMNGMWATASTSLLSFINLLLLRGMFTCGFKKSPVLIAKRTQSVNRMTRVG